VIMPDLYILATLGKDISPFTAPFLTNSFIIFFSVASPYPLPIK
jgi:hypothetical protein